MSEENVERFVENAEAFNRGDMDAATDGFGPNVVFEPQAAEIEGDFTGPDEVRTFISGLHDLYEV
jgi:SnoaL-like domain